MTDQPLKKASLAIIPFIAMVALALLVPTWINQMDLDFSYFIIGKRNNLADTYFHFMTMLANVNFVLISTIAIILWLTFVLRNWKIALTYSIALVIGNLMLNPFVKGIFQRPRPDETLRLVFADSYSFPSGHSFAAAMIYPLLVYILIRYTKLAKYSNYTYILLPILSLSIAFSRIYLGVHFLSDVIAGLSLGLTFYYLCRYFIEKYITV